MHFFNCLFSGSVLVIVRVPKTREEVALAESENMVEKDVNEVPMRTPVKKRIRVSREDVRCSVSKCHHFSFII